MGFVYIGFLQGIVHMLLTNVFYHVLIQNLAEKAES